MNYSEIRDIMVKKYKLPVTPVTEAAVVEIEAPVMERAFVVEVPNCDKLYITGRSTFVKETAGSNRAMSKVTGRYVGADKANRNNAYWSTQDLEFGYPSVTGGPVNLLHEERAIVGAITDTKFVYDEAQYGNHLTVDLTLWKYIYPQAVQEIEKASDNKGLYLSMECIAEQVQCVDACGASFNYQNWMRNKASGCEHLAKGGVRRLVNPTFLGVGLIFGAVKPGWENADAYVIKEASSLEERENLDRETAAMIVDKIMAWSKNGI